MQAFDKYSNVIEEPISLRVLREDTYIEYRRNSFY